MNEKKDSRQILCLLANKCEMFYMIEKFVIMCKFFGGEDLLILGGKKKFGG